MEMNSATFQVNAFLRLGLPPPLHGLPDHDVFRMHPRLDHVHKLGYHFIDPHCNVPGQHIRHNRIRSSLAQCALLESPSVHQFRTEPTVLIQEQNSRPADVLLESDTVFALENNGQRLCIDVTAVTTLGRHISRNPVQAHGQVKHAKPGEVAVKKENEKNVQAKDIMKDTDLSYMTAAVTDLGHQGEGMGAALDQAPCGMYVWPGHWRQPYTRCLHLALRPTG